MAIGRNINEGRAGNCHRFHSEPSSSFSSPRIFAAMIFALCAAAATDSDTVEQRSFSDAYDLRAARPSSVSFILPISCSAGKGSNLLYRTSCNGRLWADNSSRDHGTPVCARSSFRYGAGDRLPWLRICGCSTFESLKDQSGGKESPSCRRRFGCDRIAEPWLFDGKALRTESSLYAALRRPHAAL